MARSTLAATALLVMLGAGPAVAQGPGPMHGAGPMAAAHGPIVAFTVTESVESAPDMATIGTGVETRALSAKDAMAQNARQMDALIKAIDKAGVARKDIQTSGLSLNPQYDYSGRSDGEPPRFIGYVANNRLTVIVRKIDKAGDMVDAMVAAGATNLNGPSFGIADSSKLEAQARAQAVKTAGERAQAYAKAAGFATTRLLAIEEGGTSAQPVPMMAMREMAVSDARSTKIEPGQLSSSITLTVRYMLER